MEWAGCPGGSPCGAPALHSGRWGLANLELCVAALASSRAAREITLHEQEPLPDKGLATEGGQVNPERLRLDTPWASVYIAVSLYGPLFHIKER